MKLLQEYALNRVSHSVDFPHLPIQTQIYRVIVLIVTQEDDFYDPSEGSNQLIKPTGGTYRPGGRHL